jgi:chromate transporter
LAGSSFILPAALITLLFAIIYRVYGQIPAVQAAFYGIKPAVIAVILGALWRLSKTAVKDLFRVVVALLVLIAYFKGVNEVLLMFLTGFVGILWYNRNRIGRISRIKPKIGSSAPMLVFFPFLLSRSLVWVDEPERLAKLGLFFLKVGSILFGGGYLLVTFLQQDLVDRWKWLTQQQLLDAIAVGQLTPGPVLSTATFIGYQLGGFMGAFISTFGIFFPSFIIVAIINPWISKLRSSKLASGFLDGINAGVVALMAAVIIQLARTAVVDIPAVVIMLVAAAALIYYRLNSAWIIITAGLVGFGLQSL